MSSFDDFEDSILELPLFSRIQSKTKSDQQKEFISISTTTTSNTTSITTQIQSNNIINETFTIDDDSDDMSLHLSPKNASNDSIEVLFCSPKSPKNDMNGINIEEEDNEWSDCKTWSNTSSPIKASFINRTPFLNKNKQKTKNSIKKTVKSFNRKEELIIQRMSQKEERERARNQIKAQKEIIKIREKANKEVLKSKDIKESLKYCNAIIDNKLYEMAKQSIDEIFVAKEAKYRLTDNPLVPLSVTWVRKHLNLIEETDSLGHSSQASVADEEVEENHILVMIEVNVFIESVNSFVIKSGETLLDYIKNIKLLSNKKQLTLLVYKLEQYFKREKSKSQNEFRQRFNQLYNESTSQPNRRQNKTNELPSVTRDDVDLALIDMELRLMELDEDFKVSVIKANDSSELATYIFRYTRSVAESFARKEKNSQQNFEWFAEADNRNTVDPIDDDSYQQLWKKQLMQFPKVSSDVANAIVMKYKSPKSLLETYSRVTQPELLLSDIVITRRKPNGTTTERKVGRELSIRVHLFMTTRNGRQLLSQ